MIPNSGQATYGPQAEPDSGDFQLLALAASSTGLLVGCAVTAQATPNMTVAVAGGLISVNGGAVAVTAGNVTITTADATNPRIDLIAASSSGALSAIAGVAATHPVYPTIPVGSVILASVYVPNAATTITTTQILDRRIPMGTVIINVQTFGAYGDGVTDDTAAIQAAINACPAAGAVYFPAGTYLVSAIIQIKAGRRYYGAWNQTWIKMANTTNIAAIMANVEWATNQTFAGNPTYVHDLGFDGNSANNTSGHGLVLSTWQSTVAHCWFKNIPQSAVVIADQTVNGTTLVANSVVENRLYDLKIATCGQYGIWVQNFNAQCTDGRIENCDINSTTNIGVFVDRAAGWFLVANHVYNVQAQGYSLNNCFATTFVSNELAIYGANSAATGFINGCGFNILSGYPTVITNNIIVTTEAATGATYQHLSVTANGASNATIGTYAIITGNHIQGGWANLTHGTGSIGIVLTASAGQQTSGQPAGFLVHSNNVFSVQTESSVGSYISTNYVTDHIYGPAQIDGNLSLGLHMISSGGTGVVLAAGSAAGTTPPAPSSVTCHDARGSFKFGTGTSPTAGAMATVTFGTAYAAAPIVVLVPGNAATAALQLYVTSVATTGFTVGCNVAPAASQTNSTYWVQYICMQ